MTELKRERREGIKLNYIAEGLALYVYWLFNELNNKINI